MLKSAYQDYFESIIYSLDHNPSEDLNFSGPQHTVPPKNDCSNYISYCFDNTLEKSHFQNGQDLCYYPQCPDYMSRYTSSNVKYPYPNVLQNLTDLSVYGNSSTNDPTYNISPTPELDYGIPRVVQNFNYADHPIDYVSNKFDDSSFTTPDTSIVNMQRPICFDAENSNLDYENSAKQQTCAYCGTSRTPLWRKSIDKINTICNACGLHERHHGSQRIPLSARPGSGCLRVKNIDNYDGKPNIKKRAESFGHICASCGSSRTSLWRKGKLDSSAYKYLDSSKTKWSSSSSNGISLCNACGLYERLHGKARPESYKFRRKEINQEYKK